MSLSRKDRTSRRSAGTHELFLALAPLAMSGRFTRTFAVLTFLLALIVAPGIARANSAPTLGGLADRYLSEGQRLTLNVTATDSDGDLLKIGLGGRPPGATIVDDGTGSAVVSWTTEYIGPNSSAGSPFTLEVFASDGQTVTSETIFVFVQNVNRRPSISVPDSVFIEVGDTVNFAASGFDPDLDPLTWSSSTLPTGARLENPAGATTVNFRWAPHVNDSGVSLVTFSAGDIWGLADSATTALVVSVGAPFTASIDRDTVFPGELIPLGVSLKNREPITGFELVMHYDPSVMSVLSVRATGQRAEGFETFLYSLDVPAPGDLRIRGAAGAGSGIPAGDGPLFVINTLVSTQPGLAGFFLPIDFVFRPEAESVDNTLLDSAGAIIPSEGIVFVNGGLKVAGKAEIVIGDINLNGVPFEVADALRFTNYFLDQNQFGFTPEQFANSDINDDGIVASVADLVSLLSIITSGQNKTAPGVSEQRKYSAKVQVVDGAVRIIGVDGIAAGLFEFIPASNPSEFASQLTLSAEARAAGMDLYTFSSAKAVRALIISRNGGAFTGEVADALTWTDDLMSPELSAVELAGSNGATVEVEILAEKTGALPTIFGLAQNYPNPFNPSTKIDFTLGAPSRVRVVVYDALGRKITTLAQGEFGVGSHTVTWNGENDNGSKVASGVYFYRLTAGGRSLAKKMVLLK